MTEFGKKKDKNEQQFEISPKIEQLQEKLNKNPNSTLFLPLAEEYRKSGMIDEAIFYLEKGLKNNPNYALAKISLGRCYLESKEVMKAKALAEEVLAETPNNVMAQKLQGLIYLREGKFRKAQEALQKVVAFRPNDPEVTEALEQLKQFT